MSGGVVPVVQGKLVGQHTMEQWMLDSAVAGMHALAALSDEACPALGSFQFAGGLQLTSSAAANVPILRAELVLPTCW